MCVQTFFYAKEILLDITFINDSIRKENRGVDYLLTPFCLHSSISSFHRRAAEL